MSSQSLDLDFVEHARRLAALYVKAPNPYQLHIITHPYAGKSTLARAGLAWDPEEHPAYLTWRNQYAEANWSDDKWRAAATAARVSAVRSLQMQRVSPIVTLPWEEIKMGDIWEAGYEPVVVVVPPRLRARMRAAALVDEHVSPKTRAWREKGYRWAMTRLNLHSVVVRRIESSLLDALQTLGVIVPSAGTQGA
jgi:hypothetical protein